MFERAWQRDATREERTTSDTGRSALILTIVILAIMATAIAIDFSSVPAMAVLAILVLGGLIAALAAWG
jgi:small-conductance mechanosensitive channel